MGIFVYKRPFWKIWGEKWLQFHTNRCFCSVRGCKQAKKGKNHISGWTINIGKNVVAITLRQPKGCTAPF